MDLRRTLIATSCLALLSGGASGSVLIDGFATPLPNQPQPSGVAFPLLWAGTNGSGSQGSANTSQQSLAATIDGQRDAAITSPVLRSHVVPVW